MRQTPPSTNSNEYPIDLIERHFLRPPVVKLRRASRGMVRHLRGAFECPAVLEASRDSPSPDSRSSPAIRVSPLPLLMSATASSRQSM